jgi:hypothetical protein
MKSNSVRPSANVCLIAPTRDEGTTMDELESYHVDTLKLVLDKASARRVTYAVSRVMRLGLIDSVVRVTSEERSYRSWSS